MTTNKEVYVKEFNAGVHSWTTDRELNLEYLRITQTYYNELLRARGYVFLRDIYERLGIPITKDSIVIGWYYDQRNSNAHNYIDFNLDESQPGPNFTLGFNVDGDISDHF